MNTLWINQLKTIEKFKFILPSATDIQLQQLYITYIDKCQETYNNLELSLQPNDSLNLQDFINYLSIGEGLNLAPNSPIIISYTYIICGTAWEKVAEQAKSFKIRNI